MARTAAYLTGVSSAAVVLISVILFTFNRRNYVLNLKGKRRNHKDIELILKNNENLTPRRCNYSDVKKMTDSFCDNLGKGGFAGVYKGKLPNCRFIAIKILKERKAMEKYLSMRLQASIELSTSMLSPFWDFALRV
ncbi:LEAF RUST 10 DISEASE-RESISTANCE LOCUS RECEPTOR-LIKE PROTEIN KINASE-like [Olea europaea subsp. europaea]|uniref:LEAF RUST 10 DISEASE-RESISTANCE LOCUS RECEPTOR-LIKE PROTEIN KINASE-like n=1 Tax=Olea europaea subsp. europaea TaxID=158383 RepID=A0A8S0SHK8_OLEEU|nr:LEAF RUST 10 DISEASE-RESISTANCE LOCUS RECEPTOR-LIKE PROTEIN KINASE-like [Olea europaea subsp. europaea]